MVITQKFYTLKSQCCQSQCLLGKCTKTFLSQPVFGDTSRDQCDRQAGCYFGLEFRGPGPDLCSPPGPAPFCPGLFHQELSPSPGQMLTFIMLARLATLCPVPVLQRVDRLIEPLRATCTAKVSPLPSPGCTCQVLCRRFVVTIY